MPLVYVNLDQLLALEDEPTWHRQDILDHLSGAHLRQGADRKHAGRHPRQKAMGHIGQQDQHLLGRQPLLALSCHLQARFIGLDLRLACAASSYIWMHS